MNTETAINLKGTVVEVCTTPQEIMFKQGEQFIAEMNDITGVIIDGRHMTLGAARIKWMHDKLDHWIYGEQE
jgi:hypothetical protein